MASAVAGVLLALDGLEFVLSRTGILDIFVMFWLVCALACLVLDRDPLTVPHRELTETTARLTMVGGQFVHGEP